MAVRFRCTCGNALTIPSEDVGKRLACPHCTRPFRISPEKAAACAAKKTLVAPRQTPVVKAPAPPPIPAALDDAPADLDQDILTLIELPAGPLRLREEEDASAAAQPAGTPPSVVLVDEAVNLAYARGSGPAIRKPGVVADDAIQAATHSFWVDLTLAAVYPFQSIGNGLTFIGMAVLAALQFGLQQLPLTVSVKILPLLIAARFAFFGWFCAFYMGIVIETSAGSPKMPGLRIDGGWWEDVIRPGLCFLLAQAIVFIPGLVLLWQIDAPWAGLGFFCVGLFLWPMMILLLSLSDTSALYRVDLMAATILRTLPSYLVISFTLIVVTALTYAIRVLVLLQKANVPIKIPALLLDPGLGFLFAQHIIVLYFSVVSMRLIGLYYLHNKHRFAFELE